MKIVEQKLPGDPEVSEEESQERGLPDVWIHDDDRWALIIENKVRSPVVAGQLRRHRTTARRRGFEDVSILVISPEPPSMRSLTGATHRTWTEVYGWLWRQGTRSIWARRMVEYMGVAEERMTASGYLDKGGLTTFSGIHFDAENPYNYREAKRVLRLAMQELRKDPRLRKLGMDPSGEGRSKIKGRDGSSVWDFLRLKRLKPAKGIGSFTEYPHLTLSIQRERVVVIVTIPNGILPEFRGNLTKLGRDGFRALMVTIADNLRALLRTARSAKPWADVVQVHYRTQSLPPITDARVEFDLQTALPRRKHVRIDPAVKPQPQWLDATYDALVNKRSNLQVGIGAVFPYDCKALQTNDALTYIAGTWLACAPLLKAAMQGWHR